jgi:hypothetical protein
VDLAKNEAFPEDGDGAGAPDGVRHAGPSTID